jgi:hypothetical protein
MLEPRVVAHMDLSVEVDGEVILNSGDDRGDKLEEEEEGSVGAHVLSCAAVLDLVDDSLHRVRVPACRESEAKFMKQGEREGVEEEEKDSWRPVSLWTFTKSSQTAEYSTCCDTV